jgi:putative phage-type endonuclease
MNYISTKGMSREEWLEARRKGIGGSDASAIMGQNQWASPLSVYLDKRGIAPEKEETEAMRQGTDCEEVVAKRFERETGMRVKRCNKLIRHPDFPWMQANIDRQIFCKGFVGLECKTTSPYNRTDFEGGSIPANYFWQCQHYMAVTGAEEWYLAVMVFSTSFHIFRIERDENAIAQLIEAERVFWNEHVLQGIPPYPIGSDADDEAIDQMYSASPYDKAANIDDMRSSLDTLALYEQESKQLKEKIEAIKQNLKLRMGDCTNALCGRWKVTWKEEQKTSIDSKRLRAEQPETFAMYAKTSVSRPLKIKEA